ncbi:MAG: DUF308 domain-containing protein [Methanomicrobiales archaeon]
MLEVCRIPARWQGYILSGVFFLLLGIICLALTQQVMSVLLILFSAIALLMGILLIAAGVFVSGLRLQWVPLLFLGIIFIVIGLASIYYPEIVSALAIYLLAGIALLVGSLMVIYGSISFAEMKTRVLIVLLGVIALVIAGYMILYPKSAAGLLLKLWGFFACILGIALLVQGLILRRVNYEFGCNEENT